MKVYNGWILKISGNDWTVIGSLKLRGNQTYVLRNVHGDKKAIARDVLLSGMADKSIGYVASVAV